ncbi:MAG: bifunctional (p)ppGpp synthetase/guanosine-3',5'-bis(diphosphate) 3'-pyrophosphohydrolase [Acidobacteria bacterium]|nr:MAG: bifunctional (p)ppGpp synthetase/guanosine-3',5'-bis(diphosphate) 3'-pyrophosphohydrolase [Acidobacteriota bacterium]
MIRFEDILERVERTHAGTSLELLRKAYVYAAMAHRGQTRRSGEPYLTHPLEVAYILADLDLDEQTVATGLLHDAVEDAQITLDDVEAEFGPEIAQLVDGVTKLTRLDIAPEADRQAETVRKMILAMVNDIRVILVKLADRLHNMRTLMHMPRDKQLQKARETLEIYVPLAHRLGIGRVRGELEELSLRYLEPETWAMLEQRLADMKQVADELIGEVRNKLQESLEQHGIRAEITGRFKSLFSIYRKMQAQRIGVDQVYDIIAFRVITESVRECYGALGIVHAIWPPVPGRIKDYIAMPKPNLYQSLHTTVMSDKGHPFEVQIRTREMDRIAEEGIAAHWRYKDQGKLTDRELAGVQWLRQVMDWQKDVGDAREFLKYVKVDLYPGEVYVFTPKGRVISLPRGACPIDFAYAIHTEVGNQCVGARVNRRLVPLRTELKSGDIVEIITQKGHQPSRDWLAFVKTSRARTKIRAHLRAVERRQSIDLGRSLLEKEMRRLRISPREISDEARDGALAELRCETFDDLLAAIGVGKLTPGQYLALAVPKEVPAEGGEQAAEEPSEGILRRVTRALTRSPEKVKVHGLGDTVISLARCCNPIPGDAIVGYITRGRGVSVHTEDCPNLERLLVDPGRRIEVEWARDEHSSTFTVGLEVRTENRPGMLARVASVCESNKVNIRHAEADVGEDDEGLIYVVAEVQDRPQVERLMTVLRRSPGVHLVGRISPDRILGRHRRPGEDRS